MENYQFLIKDYEYDHLGIGNVLKCLITALSINDDVKIRCVPDYQYGQYDTILEDRFIYDPASPTTKEVDSCCFITRSRFKRTCPMKRRRLIKYILRYFTGISHYNGELTGIMTLPGFIHRSVPGF
jgi:hypothetical protein